jgi:hypothetical protein
MAILEGIAVGLGVQALGNLFGFGRRSAPREDPNIAFLRQMSGRMLGRGLEETEQLIPLLKQEAEEEKQRYLQSYNAYKEAVSRLAKVLETPFLPVRETVKALEQSERANIGRLVGAGLSPALAEAIAKANSEEQYFNVVEQIRQAKLNQQIQAVNAIGSLIGFSSPPMTALSALGGLVSSLTSGGMGGYSQAVEANLQQRALEEQLRMQRQKMLAEIASAIGSMYANSGNLSGGGWL